MKAPSESGIRCIRCNHYRHGAQFAPLHNGNGKRSSVCMFCDGQDRTRPTYRSHQGVRKSDPHFVPFTFPANRRPA